MLRKANRALKEVIHLITYETMMVIIAVTVLIVDILEYVSKRK